MITRYYCWLFGHKYYIVQETNNFHIFECERCKGVAVVDDVFEITRFKDFAAWTDSKKS